VNTVDDCTLLELPKISRPEGNITPVEGGTTVPFTIARVYYLYDIVAGANRAGHAHYELHQLLACVMGGCVVTVDDGANRSQVELKRGHQGLYIPPMIWREITEFTSGAVCVALVSHRYSEADYIRDYDHFVALRNQQELD
jgi:dTDP-4-dehydrorhamnose 3,5-epimerase-like enzyme